MAKQANPNDAARLARAAKLTETLRELQAKTYEITEELQKILSGQDALGDVLKRLEKAFNDEWARVYSTAYRFDFAKDRAHLKRLLKMTTEADIQARVMSYFHEADDYTRRARHPFGLFVARFNTLVPLAAPEAFLELDAAPVGCTHVPPCASDAAHTKRRREDLRVNAS
jgi:hypothetical protein